MTSFRDYKASSTYLSRHLSRPEQVKATECAQHISKLTAVVKAAGRSSKPRFTHLANARYNLGQLHMLSATVQEARDFSKVWSRFCKNCQASNNRTTQQKTANTLGQAALALGLTYIKAAKYFSDGYTQQHRRLHQFHDSKKSHDSKKGAEPFSTKVKGAAIARGSAKNKKLEKAVHQFAIARQQAAAYAVDYLFLAYNMSADDVVCEKAKNYLLVSSGCYGQDIANYAAQYAQTNAISANSMLEVQQELQALVQNHRLSNLNEAAV